MNLQDRTIHLVDLENLSGEAFAGPAVTRRAIDTYLHLADWRVGDKVTIVTNRLHARTAVFEIPPIAHTFHPSPAGVDAADHVLIAHADVDLIEQQRFGRLVIGSGDHIFAGLAAAAMRAGVEVWIIGRYSSIARELRETASQTRHMTTTSS